jgi:hypothetical protein
MKHEKGLPMAIIWDEVRISTLLDAELLQLRDNATRKSNAPIMELCELEITKRGVGVRPKRSRTGAAAADPMRARENELSAAIGAFALTLAARYDLDAETAKAQSTSTLRFQSHKLTQANGSAKLGGLQRAGKCRIDRYVSYRVRDIVVSLHIYLAKNAADDALEFQVFGPVELLTDGQNLAELRPQLAGEKEMKLFPWGKRFSDLKDAEAAFESVIAKTASPRRH